MGFAGFGCIVVALMTVPACEMRMLSRCHRIFFREMPFCLPVMTRSFFVMVRRIVVVACGWMSTGHDCPRAKER